ncbi:cysteine desulfurase NifS [candidate division WOR-1 bacterium RIFOXYB2_FULL_42_35]|uniref:cysteine desulfurase n=1 Tax=candidate division WOR-1 bacterium RIFOXYC2_FULL_41_25 TaxID=1802586 RepID=A0A1F4TL42_UNCSA|nr:MAG: cysteine desulfurase NifS [candidate division WOR-1 bacterium RIFOXYA2_FULL_41_14]OGC22944.1 MAG: cysteine desulfurase NifS [candidate division WOR-1 bacterium RIFOXYB2_FULL_42_35]OGC33425.1 MAG: cysteine desulfurase NifS [candidate division WOR-1 bacterium RIFOXYC2_FULL_41_25]OGC43929.1 MAG: cysteine desulfurase NifS [candidate division WOR-1 bacterium RIFOXYD2_FULL_41_8]
MKTIYFDYNATTPIGPEVLKEMLPYLKKHYGNPSSSHIIGKAAKEGVEKARQRVANLLGCEISEIIFTSGGSEANNIALKGVAEILKAKGNHIITSQIEHPAIINPCKYLERKGFNVTYLPVDQYGMVDPDDVKKTITPKTILITIMHANNEVGTIQPIADIGKIARKHGILFHSDAAQTIGKIETKVEKLKVDLLSIAGHKFYAPKGVGVLYIRKGTKLEPLIHGAGHESGRRAGTENVASIVGLGKAAKIAGKDLNKYRGQVFELREKLYHGIIDKVERLKLNGHPIKRLPNTLNLSFAGVDSEGMLAKMKNIALSTGSACHAGHKEPSKVLLAMGVEPNLALGAVRFSLGKYNTQREIDQIISILSGLINKIRRKKL